MAFLCYGVKDTYEERRHALAYTIRLYRERSGMTQTQAAAKLGITQSYLSKLERGERRITFLELEDIAHAYERTLEDFSTRPSSR